MGQSEAVTVHDVFSLSFGGIIVEDSYYRRQSSEGDRSFCSSGILGALCTI